MARGRRPWVRWFASKNGYFGTVNGVRVRLVSCEADDSPAGVNYLEAVAKWTSQTAGLRTDTIIGLFNAYRLHLEGKGKLSVLRALAFSRGFFDRFGTLRARELVAKQFSEWLDGVRHERSYKDNTVRTITCQVQRCFNWAVETGRIESNPFAGCFLSSPPRPRGRRHVHFLPCWLCLWKEHKCDNHRIIHGTKGGTYFPENVMYICPCCHRVAHRNPRCFLSKVVRAVLLDYPIAKYFPLLIDAMFTIATPPATPPAATPAPQSATHPVRQHSAGP